MVLWDKTAVIYKDGLDLPRQFVVTAKASIWCLQMLASGGRQACLFVYSKP